jgi:YHS domain-containing protein
LTGAHYLRREGGTGAAWHRLRQAVTAARARGSGPAAFRRQSLSPLINTRIGPLDVRTDTLDEFDIAIQSRLAAADRDRRWLHPTPEAYMGEFARRRQRYEEVARHLIAEVIRPRAVRLAGHFSNARTDRMVHSDHCILWFGYCERFPAQVKVEFAIEHDDHVEQILVLYELGITPTFLKYKAHDNLTLRLEVVDDAHIAKWVEERMLEFVETYLQIDRGSPDLDDEIVTDPVCAMRINRGDAAAQMNYRGHTYFFCSDNCRRQFVDAPTNYILFRPNV